MAGSAGLGRLVEAVAAVAIASLKGPVAGGGALVGELVKHGVRRWDAGAADRGLHRQVTDGITQWAEGEQFPEADLRLGLELAGEAIARDGVDSTGIADRNFDADKVTAVVLQAARGRDRFWGSEPHYAVAEQAIAATLRLLVTRLRGNDPVLVSLVASMHKALDQLAVLTDAVAGRASRSEVMAYLRVRLQDWDVAVLNLQGRAPSVVERRLRVEDKTGQVLSESDALTGQRGLVVLGGPGSGKTWLARRYARRAAQEALARLRAGDEVTQVELPVLTTWDRWARTSGSTRHALITASWAADMGYGHVGDPDMEARLVRTLTDQARLLVVVDSLDEAADSRSQQRRAGLISTPWRLVITSRPAAWQTLNPDLNAGPRSLRVVGVQDLTYPEDVNGFIRAWFVQQPDVGEHLINQIHQRTDLRHNAVVPLLLTFYCLLIGDPQTGHQLPRRRRELYSRLVRRLLRGPWSNTPTRSVEDLQTCEEELTRYAWAAVQDKLTAAGLGAWTETFTPPRRKLTGDQAWAVSHVVTVVATNDDGESTCRFVHRTFLEHFVAEHLAALPVEDAADLLMPHLWFDPDWAVTAPAAVVAHNQDHHNQGDLLRVLLQRAWSPIPDRARSTANTEIDQLLVDIARESAPSDWPNDLQRRIHDARIRNAICRPHAVAATSHWADSNPKSCEALLAALKAVDPEDEPEDAWDLVSALLELGPTEQERAQAREALLTVLTTRSRVAKQLIGALLVRE